MVCGPVVLINCPFCSQQSCWRFLIPSQEKFRYENTQSSRCVCIFQQRFQLSSSHSPVLLCPQLQINYDRNLGNLIVHVLQARNLAARDNDGYSDPFVKVYLLPGRGWVPGLFRVFRNICSLSAFLLLCLSGCLSPLFFLTLSPLRSLELTNWFRLYERMDMTTWGSHTGLPLIGCFSQKSFQAFKPLRSFRLDALAGSLLQPILVQFSCVVAPASSSVVWKAKERINTHLAAL